MEGCVLKTKLISGAMACLLAVSLCSCGGGADTPLSSGRTAGNSLTTTDGSKTNASTGNTSGEGSTTKSGEKQTTTSQTTKSSVKTHQTTGDKITKRTTTSTKEKPVSLDIKSITYVPEMMAGTNVTFKVSTHVELGGGAQWKAHVVIIRSYAELKKLYEEDQSPNKDIKDSYRYTKAYNESFFKDNALIGLMIQTPSIAQDHKVDQLVKKDGRLCVGMSTRVQPADAYWPAAMGDFRTLITVKQADIRDVTDIVVYNADWIIN